VCVLAPDSFTTGVDWLLVINVGTGMNGVSFGLHSLTDLDFADDVTLLADELLVPCTSDSQHVSATSVTGCQLVG